MRCVLDASVAEMWYLPVADSTKAMRLRFDFIKGLHELLAPDIFPVECAAMLVKAERQGVIPAGKTPLELAAIQAVGIPLHPAAPLLRRAAVISLTTRLTVFASLYVALAEREQCQLVTADQKVIRNTRRHFSFVLPVASLP